MASLSKTNDEVAKSACYMLLALADVKSVQPIVHQCLHGANSVHMDKLFTHASASSNYKGFLPLITDICQESKTCHVGDIC